MAKIAIEIQGEERELPSGRAFGYYLYALNVSGGPPFKTVESPDPAVVIDDVPPGQYSVHVTAYDQTRSALGTTVSGEVTVQESGDETPVFYFQPTGLSLMVL